MKKIKAKFKKGDKVLLKKDLTKCATVEAVTTKHIPESISFTGLFSSQPITTVPAKDELRYNLSNDKVVEENEIVEYSEGVSVLAKQLNDIKKSLSEAASELSFSKKSIDSDDEDDLQFYKAIN